MMHHSILFKYACALLITGPVALAQVNNLNPTNSMCLDIRNARPVNAEAACGADNDDCPPGLQCSDDDMDPLNGGICVEEAVYYIGDEIVVDIEIGPTVQLACGAQMFIEWDTDAMILTEVFIDPDDEFDTGNGGGGWTMVFSDIDASEGTIDIALALDQGVPCNAQNGTTNGGTALRLTLFALQDCTPAGVRFRPSYFPSSISGPAGEIHTVGCNGQIGPSNADDFLIGTPCTDDRRVSGFLL